ncbi:hypothetical protein NMY22_g15890 [Coprinellus aureogranulatus]|nr:hypothetical protein NMY22_g15890 [Coprinellus aureogranulatus]
MPCWEFLIAFGGGLVQSVGVDLFDAGWAQKCADVGVALDFTFPAPSSPSPSPLSTASCSPSSSPSTTASDSTPSQPPSGDASDSTPTESSSPTPRMETIPPPEEGSAQGKAKRQLGRNLYDPVYAEDFSKLSEEGGRCACGACKPRKVQRRLYHGVDTPTYTGEAPYPGELADASVSASNAEVSEPSERSGGAKEDGGVDREARGDKEDGGEGFSRAYVHHLLHTHEMSAHTLLVMHNLGVVERFFLGVRSVLSTPPASTESSAFDEEVQRFLHTYDETWTILKQAQEQWGEVDRARGKGRLAREREREVTKEAGEVGVDP